MSLEDTLQKLQEQQAAAKEWEEGKPAFILEWTTSISQLFRQMREYLSDFEAKGLLSFALQNKPITEEMLGSYVAQEMKIIAPTKTVMLTPTGRMLIGFAGGVNMYNAANPHQPPSIAFMRRKRPDGSLVWGRLVTPAPQKGPVSRLGNPAVAPQKTFEELTEVGFKEALNSILEAR